MTERDLIERARTGDPAAERELYDSHVDRVYRLAYRMTGRDDLARDFTQETFVRAFDHLDEFRGDARLSTWLHSIASRVVLNGLRTVRRHDEREAPLEEAEGLDAGASDADPDVKARLRAALDGLTDEYRMVVVMHDLEGYTHGEIGAALGIAEGSSKARLHRARVMLRETLAPYAAEWL